MIDRLELLKEKDPKKMTNETIAQKFEDLITKPIGTTISPEDLLKLQNMQKTDPDQIDANDVQRMARKRADSILTKDGDDLSRAGS